MRMSDWSSDVCSSDLLAALPADASPDDIQNIVYEIGKNEAHGFENLRDWFKALYETLLGSSAGPRMGRSEEHTSELQSLMRISYAVFCLKKKTTKLSDQLNMREISEIKKLNNRITYAHIK